MLYTLFCDLQSMVPTGSSCPIENSHSAQRYLRRRARYLLNEELFGFRNCAKWPVELAIFSSDRPNAMISHRSWSLVVRPDLVAVRIVLTIESASMACCTPK